MKHVVAVNEAIAMLQAGGVGVLPTDTVYGLTARAMDQQAVNRFYELKKRERKPGTIVAANIEQLVELGIKKRYLSAVEQWWPNPLSVVMPTTAEELAYLHLGLDSLAVRIPLQESFRQLLEQTGPLVTTSANHPNQPTAVTVAEAYACFQDNVDFYVDGGDLSNRPPSTVIRIVDDAIEVLRQGAVDISDTGRITRVAV